MRPEYPVAHRAPVGYASRTKAMGEGTMKFGVFDHMDRGPLPLAEQYENRLKLVEAYDRAGFFCYHLAEHHATPLGMAPSPAVFLSAVAQRSKRMRIGTLVYILSLQNPLRAYEDICMLDHLSGGRLELGIGRGVSPIEIEYYGVNPEESRARYQEAVVVLMQAFSSDAITFHGKHFRFDDSPVEIKPMQRPHPPLWQGIGAPDSIPQAVKNKINMVCNGQSTQVRALTDRYREEWEKAGNAPKDVPIIGMNRHIVIAETEAEALKAARPAYASWFRSLSLLWERKGIPMPLVGYTPDYDEAVRRGFIIAGTPRMVREMIDAQVESCGINYLMCRLAFGDLAFEDSMRSIELFVRDVMPQVKRAA
jgi:alkanesulfonate monooxygenase SsuD/methylene tetrahydromethanopterin reductase-like flavin-dependent oxidoreductase (luciferase family)